MNGILLNQSGSTSDITSQLTDLTDQISECAKFTGENTAENELCDIDSLGNVSRTGIKSLDASDMVYNAMTDTTVLYYASSSATAPTSWPGSPLDTDISDDSEAYETWNKQRPKGNSKYPYVYYLVYQECWGTGTSWSGWQVQTNAPILDTTTQVINGGTYTSSPSTIQIRTGSGEPTSSTTATSGELLYDKTNNDLYIYSNSTFNKVGQDTRTATLVVASSDSYDAAKQKADIICSTSEDASKKISSALSSLYDNSETCIKIFFFNGTYYFNSNFIKYENVVFEGEGVYTTSNYSSYATPITEISSDENSYEETRIILKPNISIKTNILHLNNIHVYVLDNTTILTQPYIDAEYHISNCYFQIAVYGANFTGSYTSDNLFYCSSVTYSAGNIPTVKDSVFEISTPTTITTGNSSCISLFSGYGDGTYSNYSNYWYSLTIENCHIGINNRVTNATNANYLHLMVLRHRGSILNSVIELSGKSYQAFSYLADEYDTISNCTISYLNSYAQTGAAFNYDFGLASGMTFSNNRVFMNQGMILCGRNIIYNYIENQNEDAIIHIYGRNVTGNIFNNATADDIQFETESAEKSGIARDNGFKYECVSFTDSSNYVFSSNDNYI